MTDGPLTRADYEAEAGLAQTERDRERDAERAEYASRQEPPDDPPRVLATFTPLAAPYVEAELVDDHGSLVIVLRESLRDSEGNLAPMLGGPPPYVQIACELDGFADVLLGPLLDRLMRDLDGGPSVAHRWVAYRERIAIARQVLAPVLERPTDEGDDPAVEPF